MGDHEALATAHAHRMEPENIAASKPGMKTTVKIHFVGLWGLDNNMTSWEALQGSKCAFEEV